MALSCHLPYVDKRHMTLVKDLTLIRKRYFNGAFKVDLIGLLPWDVILMLAFRVEQQTSNLASLLALLKWLKLFRCYRIVWLFNFHQQYSKVFTQLQVTLIRNSTYLFFILHSNSCLFWYIARMEGFSADSWVGQSYKDLVTQPTYVQYIFSLYFCITTFATVGEETYIVWYT
jgi:cyclic nucleotide gated channel alpha 4